MGLAKTDAFLRSVQQTLTQELGWTEHQTGAVWRKNNGTVNGKTVFAEIIFSRTMPSRRMPNKGRYVTLHPRCDETSLKTAGPSHHWVVNCDDDQYQRWWDNNQFYHDLDKELDSPDAFEEQFMADLNRLSADRGAWSYDPTLRVYHKLD